MVQTLPLNDGRSLPAIGFGMYKVTGKDVAPVVDAGIAAGYRLIDGAAFYGNERELGQAIRASGRRDELQIASKFWGDPVQSYDQVLRDFDKSADDLGLDVIDLYLIHWPRPRRNAYADVWRAFIRLRDEGRIRSIGVANFNEAELQHLIDESGVTPALNQIESHPRLPQHELRAFHAEHGIVTQAWSPLGRGAVLDLPELRTLASQHEVSTAQIVLRWHLQLGGAAVPKSVSPERLRANLALDGFELDSAAMATIATLADSTRFGTNPLDRQ